MNSNKNNNIIQLNNNQTANQNNNKIKISQDRRLFELIQNFNLFVDDNKVAYIEIVIYNQYFTEIGRKLVRIRSEDFKEYINAIYYQNFYRYPQRNVLESFTSHLIYRAKQEGTFVEIFNRLGIDKDGNIYIDLANGTDEGVRINKNGWVVGKFPVLFARYSHTASLPLPQSGGSLLDLLPFTPLKNRHEECLLLSWLVASLIPDIDRCFLLLEGSPGSRKSAIAKRVKSLIDPMKESALILTSKESDIAQHLGQHCMPYYDNITSISRDVSNMFCACFSGSVFAKKANYTDDGSFIFNLTGNIIFTSIKLEKPRPDFLERTYKINTIPQNRYKSSRELKKQFIEIWPRLFGALLDTLVKVLNVIDQIPEPNKYRTVDFDRYGAAAAEVLGYGQQTFWEARDHTEVIKTKGMVKAYPIIQSLSALLKECGGYWKGCMSELLSTLKSIAETPEQLPNAANALSNAINNSLRTEIDSAGISITPLPSDKCSMYEISFDNHLNNNTVSSSPQSNSTVVDAVDEIIAEQTMGNSASDEQQFVSPNKSDHLEADLTPSLVITSVNFEADDKRQGQSYPSDDIGISKDCHTPESSCMNLSLDDLFDTSRHDPEEDDSDDNPFLRKITPREDHGPGSNR